MENNEDFCCLTPNVKSDKYFEESTVKTTFNYQQELTKSKEYKMAIIFFYE